MGDFLGVRDCYWCTGLRSGVLCLDVPEED